MLRRSRSRSSRPLMLRLRSARPLMLRLLWSPALESPVSSSRCCRAATAERFSRSLWLALLSSPLRASLFFGASSGDCFLDVDHRHREEKQSRSSGSSSSATRTGSVGQAGREVEKLAKGKGMAAEEMCQMEERI